MKRETRILPVEDRCPIGPHFTGIPCATTLPCNFCEKLIWVSEPHFGKAGVTHDLGLWFVVKPIVDFLFALIERPSLSVTVPEL